VVVLERRPDPLPATTSPGLPEVARAAVSVPALVLGGAGAGLALIAGLSAGPVVGVGLLGWALGVAASRLVHLLRRRSRAPRSIDPYAVPDPWRRFVREALTAQAKFRQTVDQCRPGPLRLRLEEVALRIEDGVRESWRVAHLGAALDGALAGLDPTATSAELRQVQAERRRLAAAGVTPRPALDDTESALASRLKSGLRIQAAAQRATDRLRALTAELNEAVASSAELTLDAAGAEAAGALAWDVDTAVARLEQLRQGLEESERSGTPPGLPPP